MSSDDSARFGRIPLERRLSWRLRPATGEDVEYVRRRWNGYFGADRAGTTDFLARLLGTEYDGVVLVAEADGQRIGCAVAYADDADAIAENVLELPEKVPTTGRSGHLSFACVAPGYRGRGIHTAMVKERVLALAPLVDRLHTISWVRENHHDSVGMFGGTWNIVDYITDYYRQSGREYCPDCGETCYCHAVIWQLDAEKAEVEYVE